MATVKFSVPMRDGTSVEAAGVAFDVSGHTFAALRSLSGRRHGWQVSCAVTGMLLANGFDTRKEAISAAHGIATRIDNRNGPGSFSSQMDAKKGWPASAADKAA